MYESTNRSQYNETIFHFEQRGRRATLQATYTLSYANAFGGIVSGAIGGSGIPLSMNPDLFFSSGEWGPSNTDERHRFVVTGVLNLPFGIQASPIVQTGSARPYNLSLGRPVTAADVALGACCLGDRAVGDRAIINGNQVGVNAGRGIPSFNTDLRLTKVFNLGAESRKLNFYAEIYNLTNKANFGNIYNGSQASVLYQQPVAYLAGFPTSRQAQFGARFSF